MNARNVFVHRFGSLEVFAANLADAAFFFVDVETMGDEGLFPRKGLAAQSAKMLDSFVNGCKVRFHRVLGFVYSFAAVKLAGKIST